MRKAIFCFRRDLRLDDNVGLQQALAENDQVIPVFILDPRQTGAHDFKSDRAFHFMLRSLEHLNVQLRELGTALVLRSGLAHEALVALARDYQAQTIYLNRDYTPFSRQRDELIRDSCLQQGVELKAFDDALLNPPERCLKQNGSPYTIFTPFYKNASRFPIMTASPKPEATNFVSRQTLHFEKLDVHHLADQLKPPDLIWGPEDLPEVLTRVMDQEDYDRTRNELARDLTTHLSVFLKFGLVSVRAVYHQIRGLHGAGHPLIRQLYWRDFYSHIAYHFPHVFGSAFKSPYDRIVWNNAPDLFEAWCQGQTGFPIVDAGMRELNSSGFMHNRARMITASFLVKDLHIDWRRGEKYFASRLLDYDPALNNGNWQWAASTGCDAQPYFRIFNPWLQQKKFDPDCSYIKKWIPELEQFSAREIHGHVVRPLSRYISPVVEHGVQAMLAKQLFHEAIQDAAHHKP